MTATNMCSNFGGFRYSPTKEKETDCAQVVGTHLKSYSLVYMIINGKGA